MFAVRKHLAGCAQHEVELNHRWHIISAGPGNGDSQWEWEKDPAVALQCSYSVFHINRSINSIMKINLGKVSPEQGRVRGQERERERMCAIKGWLPAPATRIWVAGRKIEIRIVSLCKMQLQLPCQVSVSVCVYACVCGSCAHPKHVAQSSKTTHTHTQTAMVACVSRRLRSCWQLQLNCAFATASINMQHDRRRRQRRGRRRRRQT